MLTDGNTAAVIGALYAGSDCFFGYPITPASEILHAAAKYYPMLGHTFIQAESEEAAVSMAYGAAAAGHRALLASSGPGMSLKQEGMSYMAGSELPAVVVDVQRAGPGLGSVYVEQGNYHQAKGGGHGNYHNIVLAPNSVQEMCDLTMEAFRLAFEYRNPAVVLTDGTIGHMVEKLELPLARQSWASTHWAVRGTRDTRQNCITSIKLDPDLLESHNHQLQAKYLQLRQSHQRWEYYQMNHVDVILVAYGICSRVTKAAVDLGREKGLKLGMIRPITIYPFPDKAFWGYREKKFAVVELSDGQMCDDVEHSTHNVPYLINRYGGHVPTPEEILDEIEDMVKWW